MSTLQMRCEVNRLLQYQLFECIVYTMLSYVESATLAGV